jgi:hypothetical protein
MMVRPIFYLEPRFFAKVDFFQNFLFGHDLGSGMMVRLVFYQKHENKYVAMKFEPYYIQPKNVKMNYP